ncbi:MAG: hypothetical protein WBP61_14630 [Nocardioides sp.]
MDSGIDACVLWARAAIVGCVAFLLGVVGHVSAEGLLPGPVLLVALLTASVLLSVPLLDRQASPVRLVALLVGGQVAIHVLLTATAGHVGDRVAATSGAGGSLAQLPVVDGRRTGSLQQAYEGMGGASHSAAPALPLGHLVDDLSAHAPMMAAHLAAAAVVGLWLAYGERCLWAVLALTGRRVLAVALLLVPVVLPATRLVATVDRTPRLPRVRWHLSPQLRRGPPLLAG